MPGIRQVGDWIADRFEIFEVNQGGMGVVYAVKDRLGTADRPIIALKTLHEELFLDRERGARFSSECHLWVHLGNHANVVQAYAVEEIEGRPHILLELVTGGDLRRRIGTPELDPPRALRHGFEFCLGMEHAIRQGLRCHRDIKPANLLLTRAGVLKIADFGLAGIRDEIIGAGPERADEPIPLDESFEERPIIWDDPRDRVPETFPRVRPRLDPPPEESEPAGAASGLTGLPAPPRPSRPVPAETNLESTLDPESTIEHVPFSRTSIPEGAVSRLTRTGVMVGTLPYMAPEQFHDAKSADVRADVYSFGIVLFQMLTGRLPFRGDTVAKLERQHCRADPPSIVPAISRRFAREAGRIDEIVHRCLAKDPADRYATIPDLRRALTESLRRIDRHFDPRR
ncbi:serine/threonine-protein kinase [Paludisphaera mucosa]|uniref:Protein kinase n=1 Tax=Paludisphaera mucosa TaxID=3030827 RepID=A0ABT6F9A9_9BACT|nr:protein kinase [Paludisphaera mucosa]MDG3004171.1 protein kinase [Paludisphaera mucosa]